MSEPDISDWPGPHLEFPVQSGHGHVLTLSINSPPPPTQAGRVTKSVENSLGDIVAQSIGCPIHLCCPCFQSQADSTARVG